MGPFNQLIENPEYEVKKQPILLGILESLKSFKNYDFEGENPARIKKLVKKEIKNKVLNNETLFCRLKSLLLLRERDRTTRENSFKILKRLVKFSKKTCKILLELKMEVFVSFILEREFRHAQVIKERMQCFKLLLAWLQKDKASFPYLLG